MDFEFLIKNIPMFIEGGKLTLEIAFWGIILSILIGLFVSTTIYFNIKVVKQIGKIYVELSRNTPLLIQLFFLYYGLPKVGVHLSGFTCGIIGLAFLGGSYMAESLRGGLEAISKSQIESGLSVGLKKIQVFRYIILPQAFSIAIPSIGANCLFLLKETSIVGAIALADLMFVTKDIIGMYYKTNEALTMLIISYLIILLPMSIGIRFIERKVRFAAYGV
ncbi:MAG: amino acid ABC transporter permease [Clostridium sp.]